MSPECKRTRISVTENWRVGADLMAIIDVDRRRMWFTIKCVLPSIAAICIVLGADESVCSHMNMNFFYVRTCA